MGPLSSCSDCSVLKFFYSCLSWFCIISWNTYCFKRLKKCWNKKIGLSLQMGKNETGIRKITFPPVWTRYSICMTLCYGHMCSTSPLYHIKLYIMHNYVHHYKATGTPTCTKGTDFEWGERTGLRQTACVPYSVQPVWVKDYFFLKNEDKSQVSVVDDLAVRQAIYKS